MSDFIEQNADKFEKEKAKRLKIANHVAMEDIAGGMDREQVEVFLKQLPLDMIFKELENRLTTLCDFKAKFDELTKMSKKMVD